MCSSLGTLDLSSWDTSSVTDKSQMFNGCESLTALDVSTWDASLVSDTTFMFYKCSNLESLDVSLWGMASATDMYAMFAECSSLESLDVSKWNTSSLTNTSEAFEGCRALTSLDLSGWDTSSVDPDAVEFMYTDCDSLAEWTIGSGYAIKSYDMMPEATGKDGKWWSVTDAAWYTHDEIVENRSGVADTYKNEEPHVTEWKRLAGKDRYATMAAVAEEGFERSEFAVLATGADFPDALVASSVAGALKAPIILTEEAICNGTFPLFYALVQPMALDSVSVARGAHELRLHHIGAASQASSKRCVTRAHRTHGGRVQAGRCAVSC